ncbi:MAG: hypothetical protein Q6365_019165, partial [Candidatus Sigynarchaeota archaeon]
MLAISVFALVAVGIIVAAAGVNGLMRSKAKNIHGLPSRKSSRGNIRKYIADRKWGIGLVLMFGISSVAVGLVSQRTNSGDNDTTVKPPESPVTEIPTFQASGIQPNLTRPGYAVTLSRAGAPRLFDPAYRGSGSLWGLHVDKMRIAYYGSDNLWHETSFQINEVGYRWVADGDGSYFYDGRNGDNPNGERARVMLEEMQWKKGYVPDRFYPALRNIFWPDRAGNLPADNAAGMMLNWPEFHNNTAEEGWSTPNNSSQVRGAIDNDDEIVFLAQNGRKVETAIWYQSVTTWPYRFEVDITDPVDNGHSWVYIYYNPSGYATAPTPRNQPLNDYYRKLSYTAPGETDSVSWDTATLSIVATNYRLKIDQYHASRFNDLRITLPGLQSANIFSQFPKDFVQLQGQINFGGTTPYSALQQGLFFQYGANGNWYRDPPPGVTPLSGMASGSNTVRDYDYLQMGIGIFYHRGNPTMTNHAAYGLNTSPPNGALGWYILFNGANRRWPSYRPVNTGGSTSWFDAPNVPSPTAGMIALSSRWECLDRTVEPFSADNMGHGYFWMSNNLYVYTGSTWTLLYRPYGAGFPYIDSRNDVMTMSDANYRDMEATLDGPVMAYIERITNLKANVPLEWTRQVDADYIALLTEQTDGRHDGAVGNFDFYKQNDIVVFPNKMESRNNVYPTISLPEELLNSAIGTRVHHMYGFFKTMQFDQGISTGTRIFLGPGANQTDSRYGSTMSLLLNTAWVTARNFPFYRRIQQLGTDGVTPIYLDYAMWNWSTRIPAVPSSWYGGGTVARSYTLDGIPSNDASSYTANSPPMSDGSTREYHMWWDYTGSTNAYREQWLGTSTWRAHIRTRVTASTTVGQGYCTEFQPPATTPRNPFTGAQTGRNYPSDWYIIDVPNSGNVWVYMPTRELWEIQAWRRDTEGSYTRNLQPPAAQMHNDQATVIKDSDMKEIGGFGARLTLGGSVIPFTLSWVFGNFGVTDETSAMTFGKREWVRNRFNLDSIFRTTRQTPSGVSVSSFGPRAPAGLFYGPNQQVVTLDAVSNFSGTAVVANTSAGGISSTPATPVVTGPVDLGGGLYRHSTTFTWTATIPANVENVGPNLATRYDYYWVYFAYGSPTVLGTAQCGLFWDRTAPTAATFTLPSTTGSQVVVLDWSANKGSDNSDNTLPAPNNNGIDRYEVYRSIGAGSTPVYLATVPYGTFTFVDNNGGSGFADGNVVRYQLRTIDRAGNYAQMGSVVQTTIALPISNPGRFN